jgi:hypothetical protein
MNLFAYVLYSQKMYAALLVEYFEMENLEVKSYSKRFFLIYKWCFIFIFYLAVAHINSF